MDAPNLFAKFGGTRKMALALDEAPSTVNSWKASGRIPAHRQPAVLEAAQTLGLAVTLEDIVFPLGVPAASTVPSPTPETGNGEEISAPQQERAA